jgi:predicted ATP-grasp superfamily ATP-dependent carboligase
MLYERLSHPSLADPILIVALEGWIDAGFGAAGAAEVLHDQLTTDPVATFDTDALLDQRARRPVMHLVDGVNTGLTWPSIDLLAATDRDGRDVLLLMGSEPDHKWQEFCDDIVALSTDLGVSRVLGLGAYPAGTPHTRPVRMSITANTERLAARLPQYARGSLDVPAGVEAALEERFVAADIDAVGLWAQVPHYASGMPYPAASAALIDAAGDVGDRRFKIESLHDDAASTRVKLDQLVSQSAEHSALLAQLEEAYDQAAENDVGFDIDEPIPTGDELAAQVEEYLRDQDE